MIYEDHGINEFFFQDWLAKFKSDPAIVATLNSIADLDKLVFDPKNPSIPHIVCENKPFTMEGGSREEIKEETYIKISRKQWAIQRHRRWSLGVKVSKN